MMAECLEDENAAFWLPSHFLTDDDFLYPHPKPTQPSPMANSGFGSDPFLDSPLSSPNSFDRVAGDVKDNDSDYINELTRYFALSSLHDSLPSHNHNHNHNNQKARMISTSPQSTLTGFGLSGGLSGNRSPNGPSQVPSPPLTPELNNEAAWDLLYEAAGQVARLKMEAISARLNAHAHQNLHNAPRQLTTKHLHYYNSNQYERVKWGLENHTMRQQQQVRENSCYCHHHHRLHRDDYLLQHPQRSGVDTYLPQSAWPALSHRQGHNPCGTQRETYAGRNMCSVGSTGVVKRQSVGTGVFLPRRATTTTPPRQQFQPEPLKKPSVIVPARVAQAYNNLDAEDMNPNPQSKFTSAYPNQYDSIMAAKRNAMAVQVQQKRNMMKINDKSTGATVVGPVHEVRLPIDWTY